MRAIKFQGRLWALLPEGGHSIQGEIVEVVDAKDKSPACCGKIREQVFKSVEASIRTYNLHYTRIDEGESGLPLIDALTPPGANDIKFGKEEMDMLVDEVLGELEQALSSSCSCECGKMKEEVEKLKPFLRLWDKYGMPDEEHDIEVVTEVIENWMEQLYKLKSLEAECARLHRELERIKNYAQDDKIRFHCGCCTAQRFIADQALTHPQEPKEGE